MNDQTVTPSSIGLRYGAIVGFFSAIVVLILIIIQNKTGGWIYNLLTTAILILGIVFAYKAFKTESHGYLSYGQGLGIGTIFRAVTGLLLGIVLAVYLSVIDTSLVEASIMAEMENMEETGASDEQIETAMGWARKLSGPLPMVLINVVGSMFTGFILSLIIAAIMKRNHPEFE